VEIGFLHFIAPSDAQFISAVLKEACWMMLHTLQLNIF